MHGNILRTTGDIDINNGGTLILNDNSVLNIDNAENKLAKLEVFYKEAMMKSGWEKYKIINLKFKNQVVCTKK